MTCQCLTEHEFVTRLHAAKVNGLPVVEHSAGPEARRLTAAVFDATEFVMTSDLRFRRAERVSALGLDPSRARVAKELATFHNRACLDVLREEVRPAIAAVREQFVSSNDDIECKRAWDFFEGELREGLADIDLSLRRARAAGRVIDRARAAGDNHGIAGLCHHIDKQVERLIELREEREEHNNVIFTAVGAAIAATGFLILGICSAVSGGRACPNPFVRVIAYMHLMAGLAIMLLSAGADDAPLEGGEEGGGIGEDGGTDPFPEA